MKKKNLFLTFLTWLEKYIYYKADRISVITSGFKDNLIKKGISEKKIFINPNWPLCVFSEEKSNLSYNDSRKTNFEVIYSGAIGKKDNLFTILKAAQMLQEKKIVFKIIGDGPLKSELVKEVDKNNLNNVIFLPLQSFEQFQKTIQNADALVVSYYQDMIDFCLPSKILTYLSSGTCLIALSNENSEVAKLLKSERKIAVLIEPENEFKLAEILIYLMENQNEAKEIGDNGKRFVMVNFDKTQILNNYQKFFEMKT